MHKIVTSFAALGAVTLLSAPSIAAEKREVSANKTSPIGFFYFATGMAYNCQSSGKGTFKLANEPEHGKVHLEWRKVKGNFNGGCKSSTMGGVAAWYTPQPGYRGKDDFSIRISVPGLMPGNASNSGKTWTIVVDVK